MDARRPDADGPRPARDRIAGKVLAAALLLAALVAGARGLRRPGGPATPATPKSPPPTAAEADAHPAFLHGRVLTIDGATYEGRLRFGGQEAFWGDFFNGAKKENPWVARVPPDRLPRERRPVEILGIRITEREKPVEARRLFMARFGDIARIDTHGREVRVTLKSGSTVVLDRLEASDFDDDLRVWDRARGATDLDSLRIRAIELLSTDRPARGATNRLHGTVRTLKNGVFTGFVQWNRAEGVGSDTLDGLEDGRAVSLPYDTIRTIARLPPDRARVTLADGRERVVSGTAEAGDGHRGLYVDDPRYGRVLVSWAAFDRVDFTPGATGPTYADFPPGRPLTGRVATHDGRVLAGRLVYDLDESETTDTLDAPSEGVDYTIPFGLVASILPGRAADGATEDARVTLHDGEALRLERAGDLGAANLGLLIFADGRGEPAYVPWAEVREVTLDRPPAVHPSPAAR